MGWIIRSPEGHAISSLSGHVMQRVYHVSREDLDRAREGELVEMDAGILYYARP